MRREVVKENKIYRADREPSRRWGDAARRVEHLCQIKDREGGLVLKALLGKIYSNRTENGLSSSEGILQAHESLSFGLSREGGSKVSSKGRLQSGEKRGSFPQSVLDIGVDVVCFEDHLSVTLEHVAGRGEKATVREDSVELDDEVVGMVAEKRNDLLGRGSVGEIVMADEHKNGRHVDQAIIDRRDSGVPASCRRRLPRYATEICEMAFCLFSKEMTEGKGERRRKKKG